MKFERIREIWSQREEKEVEMFGQSNFENIWKLIQYTNQERLDERLVFTWLIKRKQSPKLRTTG